MKHQADIVVIGGGIMGCSILYHLAKAGCRNVVLLEKGEITSGSTCMAAGLLTQFSPSPTMMRLRKYSAELYQSLGVFEKVGSLRLAASAEQHKNLQRGVSQARGIGLDVDLLTPAEALKLMPWMSGEELYSAIYLPGDGHLDPHGATHAVSKAARDLGAEICLDTLVTGIDLNARGEVVRVRTSRGDILTPTVVNAAGMWGPQVAAMVGARVPATPVVHQHVTLQAVPGHEVPDRGPCFRDTDYLIYGKPEHSGLLVGGWEANPPSIWEDGVPWSHSASEVASDFDRFEPMMLNAIKRYPFLAESGIERLVAHPDAITPDSNPLIGPWPGLRGFWLACGLSMHGFGGAGGLGRQIAQWILEGGTDLDLYGYHAWRFGRNYRDPAYAAACARECYKYYYRTFYPHDESAAERPRRLSPLHYRLQDLGAVFGQKNGWERVNYVATGQPWRRAGEDQRDAGGWTVKPAYFEAVAEEHRAIRERAGLVDLTSFGKIEIRGPGALALLNRLAAGRVDSPVGAVIYTPLCNIQGGVLADVTISRLAEDRFLLVTGAGFIDNDLGHIRAGRREQDPPAEIRDVTEDYACIALWGPNAAQVLSRVTPAGLLAPATGAGHTGSAVQLGGSIPTTRNGGCVTTASAGTGDTVTRVEAPGRPPASELSGLSLCYMRGGFITLNGVRLWAQRVSYVGESGWELYPAAEEAVRVWDALWAAGQEFGIAAVGYKALDSLRLEKGYLCYTSDITSLDNPFEAGLGFALSLDSREFLGRGALLKARESGLCRKICTLVIGSADWLPLYGGEAVLADGKAVSRLRSAGYGHNIRRNVGYAYLPLESWEVGTRLDIEVFGDRVPAEVAPRVLYDPEGRALGARCRRPCPTD